jgi:DNA-binding SARP family transcriptional activator
VGDYLVEESRLDWPLARQERLRQQSVEALEALARLHLEQNDPTQVAELAERLLSIDKQHEAGYLLLMRTQVAFGQPKDALRTYQRYLKNCCEELDFPIDPKIQQFYEQIRKELKKNR